MVNVRINVSLSRVRESFLPWKSNKYCLLVSVCMNARACVCTCVHVGTRERRRVHAHTCM